MKTEIIDGKALSISILKQLEQNVIEQNIKPKLLIIQVGDHPTSTQYVLLKKIRGAQIGVEIIIEHLVTIPPEQLRGIIRAIIARDKNQVDGIMIQLPLPDSVNTEEILALIPAELDVDGLRLQESPWNTAVADAVLELLAALPYATRTKQLLVIGESPYVGGSIKTALKKADYEYVSTLNEFTPHKEQHIHKAEIVISCSGSPHHYNARQLQKGAVLIDVGTSKNTENVIVGDFDVSKAEEYLSAFTPVPGGVGPITVAMLLKHVVENAITRHSA